MKGRQERSASVQSPDQGVRDGFSGLHSFQKLTKVLMRLSSQDEHSGPVIALSDSSSPWPGTPQSTTSVTVLTDRVVHFLEGPPVVHLTEVARPTDVAPRLVEQTRVVDTVQLTGQTRVMDTDQVPVFTGSGVRPRRSGVLPERITQSGTESVQTAVGSEHIFTRDKAHVSGVVRAAEVSVSVDPASFKKEIQKVVTSGFDQNSVRSDSLWIPAFSGMTKKPSELVTKKPSELVTKKPSETVVNRHSLESGNPGGTGAFSLSFDRMSDHVATSVHPVTSWEGGDPVSVSSQVRHRRPGPLPDRLTHGGVVSVLSESESPIISTVGTHEQSAAALRGVRITAQAVRQTLSPLPPVVSSRPKGDVNPVDGKQKPGKTISLTLSGRLAPAERQWLQEAVKEAVREEGELLLKRHLEDISSSLQQNHTYLLNRVMEIVQQEMAGAAPGRILTPELLRSFAEAFQHEISLQLKQQESMPRGVNVESSLVEETQWPTLPEDMPPVTREQVVHTRALFEQFMTKPGGALVGMGEEASAGVVEEVMFLDSLESEAINRVSRFARTEEETVAVEEMLPGVGHLVVDMADGVRRGLGQVGQKWVGKKIS